MYIVPADYAKKQKVKRKRPRKDEAPALTTALQETYADGQDFEVRRKRRSDTPARERRRQQLRARRKAEGAKPCSGLNLVGQPCKSPALRKGTMVANSGPASGEFCLNHDPSIDLSAVRSASGRGRVRRPLDLLAEAVARAPGVLFQAQFEAIGKEWDPDTQELKDKIDPRTGKPMKGATHVGFSREGVARKSRHKDYALQTRVEKELNDRLFGKPRQALEISSGADSEMVDIPQTSERAMEVASILSSCGAIPGGTVPSLELDDDEDGNEG